MVSTEKWRLPDDHPALNHQPIESIVKRPVARR